MLHGDKSWEEVRHLGLGEGVQAQGFRFQRHSGGLGHLCGNGVCVCVGYIWNRRGLSGDFHVPMCDFG